MLVAAAAQMWNVDAASCRAHRGVVARTPTRRTLAYGALVDRAATLPVPTQVTLKDPKDLVVYGHFFPGTAITDSGPGLAMNYLLVSTTFTF